MVHFLAFETVSLLVLLDEVLEKVFKAKKAFEARLRDGRPKFRNAAGKSFQSKTTKSKSFQNNQEMDHIISPPA